MTWDDFGASLAEVLSSLAEREFLVVSLASLPTVSVELAQSAAELVVTTGADDMVPADLRLGAAGADVLQRLGWSTTSATSRNAWSLSVPWPLRSSDYRRVAGDVVTVLRELYGVAQPDLLEYRSWREPEPAPVGVTFLEADLEPGDPHLLRPQLGIADAHSD